MKSIGSSILLASLALVGCFGSQELEVRITPDAYQVGNVKSALATPAVDEVVRMAPRKVLMVMCSNTPPTKVIQFEKELRARHEVKLQGSHTDQGCPV